MPQYLLYPFKFFFSWTWQTLTNSIKSNQRFSSISIQSHTFFRCHFVELHWTNKWTNERVSKWATHVIEFFFLGWCEPSNTMHKLSRQIDWCQPKWVICTHTCIMWVCMCARLWTLFKSIFIKVNQILSNIVVWMWSMRQMTLSFSDGKLFVCFSYKDGMISIDAANFFTRVSNIICQPYQTVSHYFICQATKGNWVEMLKLYILFYYNENYSNKHNILFLIFFSSFGALSFEVFFLLQ